MSRTVNVSASRRVTTPLIFIFWPLVTVREPLVLVVSCAKDGEAEKTKRQVVSTAGANNLCLVNTIDFSPCIYVNYAPLEAPSMGSPATNRRSKLFTSPLVFLRWTTLKLVSR